MINLVRDYRDGKLTLFAPPRKPGPAPGSAPAKERVRGRVIELRRDGPVDLRDLRAAGHRAHAAEPHQRRRDPRRGRLRAAAAPPRAGGQHQPGHRRPRHPAAPHRAARLPILARHSRNRQGRAAAGGAGPGLDSVCPSWSARAGYPGTRVVPAVSWLLSLLALKLTRTRRVSHVDDLLLSRPGRGPVRRAGRPAEEVRAHRLLLPHRPRPPAPLPGRPGREDDRRRAGHRRRRDLRPGLPRRHALGPRPRPGEALRAHPLPARPLGADLLRPGHRHPQPGLRQRRPRQIQPGPRGDRVLRPLESRLRQRPRAC